MLDATRCTDTLLRSSRRAGLGLLTVLSLVTSLSVGASQTGAKAAPVLRVLVTNDDGVGAPGIDAAVQGLRALPHTNVVVVAPAMNQSGTGGMTVPGQVTAQDSQTASGYHAEAVNGYPADTIRWAITQHGVARRPELVVSGINFGQNTGPLAAVSGTVGVARAAAALGIPAIAVSQGIDNGYQPNFAQSADQLVRWVQSHRAALVKGSFKARQSVQLNVPTCPGSVRGPVHAALATSAAGINVLQVNCTSASTSFSSDVDAFVNGYAVFSPLGKAS